MNKYVMIAEDVVKPFQHKGTIEEVKIEFRSKFKGASSIVIWGLCAKEYYEIYTLEDWFHDNCWN